MSEQQIFYVGLIRLVVYIIVAIISIHSLFRSKPTKIIYIGDLLFVLMSIVSFVMQNFFKQAIAVTTVYIFTPAFFIWGLTRVIDLFSVTNFIRRNDKRTT